MPAERTYVPNVSPPGILTADDLLEVRIPDKHVELVRGVLMVRELPGFTHGRVAANLTGRLSVHLESTGANLVLLAETGFKLAEDPDTVRGPDLAVVRRDRLPVPEPRGFMALGPELVVEVLSPATGPVRCWPGWATGSQQAPGSCGSSIPHVEWPESTATTARSGPSPRMKHWRERT
jgi:hypothetical protein